MPVSLIIHGYPQPIAKDHLLYDFFEQNNWEVIAPYLFTDEFVLSRENAQKYLEKELGDKKPDVIVGVSLGGLIAPLIAQNYPDSKLVLIATGAYFKPRSKMLWLVLIIKKFLGFTYKLISLIPKRILFLFYRLVSPLSTKDTSAKEVYNLDAKRNIDFILKIPASKHKEIIDSALKIDNRQLLTTIKNKTLIFTGKNDVLMPLELSRELRTLIAGSRLVITPGQHFNVFTKDNLADLKAFLA